MAKQQKTTLWMRAANTAWKRIAIVFGIVVGIPLLLYGITEYSYQQRINTLSNAIDQVWQNPVKTVEATAPYTYVKAPHYFESLCIDNGPCPTVTRSWLALVSPNQEADFIRSTLRQSGYQTTVYSYQEPGAAGVGTKGRITLSVGFYAPENNEHPPYQAPSGKIWRSFSVDAYEVAN